MRYGGKGGDGRTGSGGGPGFPGGGDSGGGGGSTSYLSPGPQLGGAGGRAGGGDNGGDGGDSGASGSSLTPGVFAGTTTGGAGGKGVGGAGGFGGGGGGGGAGGYGLVVGSSLFANGGMVTGGGGGAGGSGGIGVQGANSPVAASGGYGGGGGDGSGGILLYAASATLRNTGEVYGGAGGLGGDAGTRSNGTVSARGGAGGAGGDGVDMVKSGGTLVNYASAEIDGGKGGDGGSVSIPDTAGALGGRGGDGVRLYSGNVTNQAGARIIGGAGGAAGAIYGSGNLAQAGYGGYGVRLLNGGMTFDNGGYIAGGAGGIGARDTNIGAGAGQAGAGNTGGIGAEVFGGTFTNTGTIKGGSGGAGGAAMPFFGGGGGTGGDGGSGGFGVDAEGTVVNSGTITGGAGGSAGVGDAGDGVAGAGAAGLAGLDMTIVNSGLIAGGAGAGNSVLPQADAVTFFGGANFLALGSGADFNGALDLQEDGAVGGSTSLTFDQSKGTGLPADVQLSTAIIGVGSVVKVGAGKLTLRSTGNTFSGGMTIEGGTLELASVGSGGKRDGIISFQAAAGSTATLAVKPALQADNTAFDYTLDNFGDGDSLDLENLAYTGTATATPLTNEGVLLVQEGGKNLYFYLSNSPTGVQYYAHKDAAGTGTLVDDMVCFAEGTAIRVVRGGRAIDVAVEHLVVGDRVVTVSGATRPIRWLGHRRIDCRRHPRPHAALPIRVAAHAFGIGLPARDLHLSPGHPVLVGADADGENGHLVPIMCLISGTTVRREAVDAVTYWHIELDGHDILLAEGLPAESYLDWGDRAFFTQGADHALANPDFVVPGLAGRCRPVALDGPVVEAERRRLDGVFAMRLAAACDWSGQESALAF